MKKGVWRGLDAELDELEASDPAVRAAKERLNRLPDTFARYERHMAARRAVGKRAVPEDPDIRCDGCTCSNPDQCK